MKISVPTWLRERLTNLVEAIKEPDVMGDTCLLCDQPLDDHDNAKCPADDEAGHSPLWPSLPVDVQDRMIDALHSTQGEGYTRADARFELRDMHDDTLRDHLREGIGYEVPLSPDIPQDDTVWTATAVEGAHEDVEPLCVVAITHQAAQEQLENLISEQSNPDMWIAYNPVERKVLK